MKDSNNRSRLHARQTLAEVHVREDRCLGAGIRGGANVPTPLAASWATKRPIGN